MEFLSVPWCGNVRVNSREEQQVFVVTQKAKATGNNKLSIIRVPKRRFLLE